MASRRRSSSPFSHRRPSSPFSSSSSTSSFLNSSGRFIPRSCSTSGSSFYGSAKNGSASKRGYRSPSPDQPQSDTMLSGGSRSNKGRMPVGFSSTDDLPAELDAPSRSSADSISVTIRFRPMNEREYQCGDEIAWYPDGDKLVRSESNHAVAYAFDKVFNENAVTDDVYEVAARPVVKSAMDGVNGTVFAYGVTSSGKTHTMHGDHDSPGIIPLAIKDVFSIIQDTPGREFLLRVSYLEIYNEVINDLLDPTGQNLRIREDVQGTYVEGMKEEVVLSPGHALSFIASGEEHRHVGSNNFNLLSSRSHTIFTLMIESSARGDEYDGVIFSQLNLIDLAGSESSKTETTGLRRKEGSFINKSLLTLGTVIGKLSEGKASHVPYRDSKLTRLLQSSLSGKGHVSLICTITPASSSMEESHNTLKFASRAKRVEIYASRNKIIDEKSLIKKYQREISTLKEELDQLRQGMLVGVSHEEIVSLRQKLEEGQVKMQSRLEEEEEAKSALLSRIQRLTKLILVSTKNAMPGYLSDLPSHHRAPSTGDVEKPDVFKDGSLVGEVEDLKESQYSPDVDLSGDSRHRRSSCKWTDDLSPSSSTIAESNQAGEHISGSNVDVSDMTLSDEMDLMMEQIKMLAGDIAFSTSTLKRLVEQSIHDPDAFKTQIHNMEREIQEKRIQMRILEQRIVQSGETSVANASLVDMQQTVTRLTNQCNEKAFELELKTADNRILQEQLESKFTENKDLRDRILVLEQQLASSNNGNKCSFPDPCHIPDEYVEDLKRKIKSQEFENEKLRLEHVQFQEENSGLRVHNQKLAEEACYAKELASAAAIELKNLADEITKLSLQNAKLEKELQVAHTRNVSMQDGRRKYSDGIKQGRKGRISSCANGNVFDDFNSCNLDLDDLKMELQSMRQQEAVLEAALAEKTMMEEEYRRKAEEAMKREASLENDLANMWVLVAQLKKETRGTIAEPKADHTCSNGEALMDMKEIFVGEKAAQNKDEVLQGMKPALKDAPMGESLVANAHQECETEEPLVIPAYQETSTEEPLVARLKARIQDTREKEPKYLFSGDVHSRLCKVCFETATAAVLLPCRHFCLCKPCSFACSECPICRTSIADRIIAFMP